MVLMRKFYSEKKKYQKESAALCPIAPRGKGLALRCYPSALFTDMALVVLPIVYERLSLGYCSAMSLLSRHVNHIYGIPKAPSCSRLHLDCHLFGIYSCAFLDFTVSVSFTLLIVLFG